ncbi:hypothetical protein [Corynebacterium kozikiae]|uniref:hypothetical protein n=1 Tax=Corynebacterium kozikiae TaxID=2968469 RepID=UPI00211B98C8|nr:hypothetical protein [Corynebacterium sp. 76QC2CO]MCQ9342279.1 hypothetical protein [Corynebacterium sp. 76QC2CO]
MTITEPTRSTQKVRSPRPARSQRSQSHVSRDLSGSSYRDDAGARRNAPQAFRKAPAIDAPKRRNFQRRAGSNQVFSYRGRRVERPKVDQYTVRLVIGITGLLVLGVLASMLLSGMATSQTFALQQLKAQERILANQVETLNRDLQEVSSSAALAQTAAQQGMVLPDQPGILGTDEQGNTVEQRPAADLTRPIVDVNGEMLSGVRATSDPEGTEEVSGTLNAVPQPYAPNQAVSAPYATSPTSN